MPSCKVIVNFVAGVPTTITVSGSRLEKNVSLGVYIDGVLMESTKTSPTKETLDHTFTIPAKFQADLLNHSMFAMGAPLLSKTGSIGFCTLDNVKLELRYV